MHELGDQVLILLVFKLFDELENVLAFGLGALQQNVALLVLLPIFVEGRADSVLFDHFDRELHLAVLVLSKEHRAESAFSKFTQHRVLGQVIGWFETLTLKNFEIPVDLGPLAVEKDRSLLGR